MNDQRALIEAAAYVVSRLEQLGVRVPSSSRFDRMQRTLSHGRIIGPRDDDFEVAVEAVRDIRIMEFILDQLPDEVATPALERLRLVVDDGIAPNTLSRPTSGRDAQFELYVHAVCSKAGMQPVFAEPDIVATVNGEKIAFAAKRMKSNRRFESLVKGAVKQSDRVGIPAMIAVDASVSFNQPNRVLASRHPEAVVAQTLLGHIEDFVRKYEQRLRGWTADSRVFGMLVLMHVVANAGGTDWGLDTYTMRIALPRGRNNEYRFDRVWRLYERGLPGDKCK